MLTYINYVRDSLWDQSVNDILDSTTQVQEAFQSYMDKDVENLSIILRGVSSEKKISYLQLYNVLK